MFAERIHIPVDLLVDGLDLVRLEWGLSYQQRVPVNGVMLNVSLAMIHTTTFHKSTKRYPGSELQAIHCAFQSKEYIHDDAHRPYVDLETVSVVRVKQDLGGNIIGCSTDSPKVG